MWVATAGCASSSGAGHRASKRRSKTWGLCPPNPQDLPLYSHRSPCCNPPAAEEDRAPVGTDPFDFAQGRPERLSGAAAAGDARSTRSSPLGFLGRLRWLESDKSQGGWGTGPPGLPPNILGAPTENPEEPRNKAHAEGADLRLPISNCRLPIADCTTGAPPLRPPRLCGECDVRSSCLLGFHPVLPIYLLLPSWPPDGPLLLRCLCWLCVRSDRDRGRGRFKTASCLLPPADWPAPPRPSAPSNCQLCLSHSGARRRPHLGPGRRARVLDPESALRCAQSPTPPDSGQGCGPLTCHSLLASIATG